MDISKELYKPFDNVPSRRGRGGIYTYIKWQDVADRMNSIFGMHWSSETVSQDVVNENVIVRVRVTVKSPELNEYFFQEGFGGAPLNDGSEPGNPFKSAYSKAFKDACKKWGVALYKEDTTKVSTQVANIPAVPGNASESSPTPAVPVAETSELPTAVPPQNVAPSMPAPPAPQEVAMPSLPPNVPEIAEQEIVLQQAPVVPEIQPVQQEVPPQPVASSPPAPAVPTDAVIPETPVAVPPPEPATQQVAQPPARPENVPLSPIDRVRRAKQNKASQESIPAVPSPAANPGLEPTQQSANTTPPTNEGLLTNVQKVAIEGLIDMKGLEYTEIATKALNITNGAVPPVETLTHAQAISVIRHINDLYK